MHIYSKKKKILLQNLFTANSSQFEQIKYVYVCLSKQCITSTSKNIYIKEHFKKQKISLWTHMDHKSISVREYMVYYLSLPQQIPLFV